MDRFLNHLAQLRAQILRQMETLRFKLSDLEAAERLYRESSQGSPKQTEEEMAANLHTQLGFTASSSADMQAEIKLPVRMGLSAEAEIVPSEGSLRTRVLGLLRCHPAGLTSQQILHELREMGLSSLAPSSLSPALSRMKAAGEVVRTYGLWRIGHKLIGG